MDDTTVTLLTSISEQLGELKASVDSLHKSNQRMETKCAVHMGVFQSHIGNVEAHGMQVRDSIWHLLREYASLAVAAVCAFFVWKKH